MPLTVVVTDLVLPTLSSLVTSTIPSGRWMVLVLLTRSYSYAVVRSSLDVDWRSNYWIDIISINAIDSSKCDRINTVERAKSIEWTIRSYCSAQAYPWAFAHPTSTEFALCLISDCIDELGKIVQGIVFIGSFWAIDIIDFYQTMTSIIDIGNRWIITISYAEGEKLYSSSH